MDHPVTDSKYQLLPPLAAEERAALKESIKSKGILTPIERDEHGDILDGHHRMELYEELTGEGFVIPKPTVFTRRGMTEEQKRDHVLTINLIRRHLTRDQRNEIWATLRVAGRTLSQIATLSGVQTSTVMRALEGVEQPAYTVGADGKMRPTSYFKPSVVTGEEAMRLEAAALAKIERSRIPEWMPNITDRYMILHGDFRTANVPDDSVDAIITDPPYPKEFLPLFGDLAKFAATKLVDGGMCIVLSGQAWLPEVLALMTPHLTYQWTMCYLMQGATNRQNARHAYTAWKPLLVFTKGPMPEDQPWFRDVLKVEGIEKEYHVWGQNVESFVKIIEIFTSAGDVICDPFLGGGTTAIAALLTNRVVIGIDVDKEAVNTSLARIAALIEEATLIYLSGDNNDQST